MGRRSGRRAGDSGTREAIRAAAARQFAELGYDRTSLRSIAAEAGVDPALVAYFFGRKQELFVEVVGLPFDPSEVVPMLFAGDRAHLGERLARFVVSLLEDPDARGGWWVWCAQPPRSRGQHARCVRWLRMKSSLASRSRSASTTVRCEPAWPRPRSSGS